MAVSATTGMCQCPQYEFYQSANTPVSCVNCLSKCATCNSDQFCLTYRTCNNQYQTLSNGKCSFKCGLEGYQLTQSTCGTCSDPNCQVCDISSGSQRCGLCQNGYYLNLATYTCVQSCPTMSQAVSSSNVYSSMGTNVRYCRPYNGTFFNYTYYVDPSSTLSFELGTIDYPFKNMDSPAKEVFNFFYQTNTTYTVYHRRGTSMKMYYGIMPIVFVNIGMYTLTSYGDPTLPKPYVYITGDPYQWPDTTLFSIAENYYDFATRVLRGDMSSSEASTFFLKFNVFRGSLSILGIDFQSIMFGTAPSNPLIYTFDAINQTVYVENCYLDLDGNFVEGYSPIALTVNGSHFNVTNYQYGIWLNFETDCYTTNTTWAAAPVKVVNNLFTNYHQQALYNFIYLSSFDDVLIINNTFTQMNYLNMATRPFLDTHPSTSCDPPWRTQHLQFNNNQMVNLANSNIIFAYNYMNQYNGTRVFQMMNNFYNGTIINTQFVTLQIEETMNCTVGNNYYQNVTVLPGNTVFYYFSQYSNLNINNETLIGNTLDDLYTIGNVNSITVSNFSVSHNVGTGSITETSAIVRVSQANANCTITNFTATNSVFIYGKAIEIDSAYNMYLGNSTNSNNQIQNQDFIVLNQIVAAKIENLLFFNFSKVSDTNRFGLTLQTLTLTQGISTYLMRNITYINSFSSFFSVQQVQLANALDTSSYNFTVSNCTASNNSLSSKDSLIQLGQIDYLNFLAMITQLTLTSNVLQLGNIFSLQMNSRQLLLKSSNVFNNTGQFASLQPASSDTTNPLVFYINDTIFFQNYAMADALIQLTTNSIMYVVNSNFTENYSIGRGSIVFADYQAVYASFYNCTMVKNYAYQGGVFYIQYSSSIEISLSVITQNFAVTGGVAYVNNDGFIKINNQTQIYNNSALNTCFLFLINTQYQSFIDNITITQNDQVNPLIPKTKFLSINSSYLFMQATYFNQMQLLSTKIQRTINEIVDSAVYSIKAGVNFTNTIVKNNDVFLSASTESTVGFVNCSIININATNSIISVVSSTVEFYSVTMANVTYVMPSDISNNFYKISVVNQSLLRTMNLLVQTVQGLLLYVTGSTMFMDGTKFYNVTNDDTQNSLFQIDTSSVNVTTSIFNEVYSVYSSPIINLQQNEQTINSTTFSNFDKTLFALYLGDFIFDQIQIFNGQMIYPAGQKTYSVNSIVFDSQDCNIQLLRTAISGIFTSYNSPVLYLYNDPTSLTTSLLTIQGSSFNNNTATLSAGVIYLYNANATINESSFTNNSALTQDAGVFLFDCELTAAGPCFYNISNSVFVNNSASINGGAIQFTFYEPNITTNNTFTNCTAQYGPQMASYATTLQIQQIQRMLETSTTTNQVIVSMTQPLVSGNIISQNVTLQLLDNQGRLMNTDNSSTAIMSSSNTGVQVMKTKQVTAVQGTFTFNQVIIIGPPGSNVLLQISSPSINQQQVALAFPSLGQIPTIFVEGYLRWCERGEYQSSDSKCILCQDGFFTLQANSTNCTECVPNAICTNGYEIIVNPGYWRQSVNATNVYACYNADACISSYEVECAPGYANNLCHSCVEYNGTQYSRSNEADCEVCIDLSTNSWRLAGVSLCIVAYIAILIAINIKQIGSQGLATVYMRIITNYFQILTLAQSYDLSWDDNMLQFMQAMSFITNAEQIILSIDCFLKDNGVVTNPVFIKMIIICLIPVGGIIILCIIWLIIGTFCKKRVTNARTKLLTSIIILIFIALPPITTITFSIYNCIDIFNDGDTWLAVDLGVQCWTGDHEFYALRFGIPILVIWIIGCPLLALILMFRQRKVLGSADNMQKYGFLYVGLNHRAYYWEILLHFRKLLMISINVFFTTFNSLYRVKFNLTYQALIGFMLMIVYIELLQKIQPYQNQEINNLEFKANIAAFATFYGGLFFISDSLPLGVSTFLFLLILGINLFFWLSWFKLIFNNFYVKLKNWFMKTLCPNKYKQKKDIALLENAAEIEDNLKAPKDSFREDDSSRFPLALNESNRMRDETARKEEFVSGKKTKKGKTKEVKESSEQESSSINDKKKKKIIEMSSGEESSGETKKKDKKKKKKSDKEKRKKDIEKEKKLKDKGTGGSGDSSSINNLGDTKSEKQAAGEILDKVSSDEKKKSTTLKVSSNAEDTANKVRNISSEDLPPQKVTSRSKKRDDSKKEKKRRRDNESDEAEEVKPKQKKDKSRSKSQQKKDEEYLANQTRVFQNVKAGEMQDESNSDVKDIKQMKDKGKMSKTQDLKSKEKKKEKPYKTVKPSKDDSDDEMEEQKRHKSKSKDRKRRRDASPEESSEPQKQPRSKSGAKKKQLLEPPTSSENQGDSSDVPKKQTRVKSEDPKSESKRHKSKSKSRRDDDSDDKEKSRKSSKSKSKHKHHDSESDEEKKSKKSKRSKKGDQSDELKKKKIPGKSNKTKSKVKVVSDSDSDTL